MNDVLTLGFYIRAVTADGPAYHAGLQRGDVIIAINDKPIGDLDDAGVYEALGARPCRLWIKRWSVCFETELSA